jgi:hypothetical protein
MASGNQSGEADVSNNTGGPAFPTGTWEYDGQNNVLPYQEGGMTLRDYFAAKAMQELMTYKDRPAYLRPVDEVATDAYEMADAMLKARN